MAGDQEIWFDRVLWSYMLCHWKGWAILFGTIVLTMTTIFGLQFLLALAGRSDLDDFAFVVLIMALVWLDRISKRHSKPI